MKRNLLWAGVGCLAMAFAPARAIAVGQITQISVAKSTFVGETVNVRVYGFGVCSQVVLRCEEGDPTKRSSRT